MFYFGVNQTWFEIPGPTLDFQPQIMSQALAEVLVLTYSTALACILEFKIFQ